MYMAEAGALSVIFVIASSMRHPFKRDLGFKMGILAMNSEVSDLRAEEELILANFTRRLMEIAAVSGAPGAAISPTAMLNAMRLPAIALDRHGFAVEANTAAEAVFDDINQYISK
jgi:hypothetical protein